MSKVRLRCHLGGDCGYETVLLESEQAKEQVESHMRWAHSNLSSNNAQPAGPTIPFIEFLGLWQSEGETASQFVSRLKNAAGSCDFTVHCPSYRSLISYSNALLTQKLVDQQGKENTVTLRKEGNEDPGSDVGEKEVPREEEIQMLDVVSRPDALVTQKLARDHYGKENNDTLSEDRREEGQRDLGADEGPQEEENEVQSLETKEDTPGKAETEIEGVKEEAEIEGVKEEADEDELMILDIETVTPVPARKRRRSTEYEGKKETIFTCVICWAYFYGKGNLRDHYSLTHYKGKLRRLIREDKECPICMKTFSTTSNTIRHLGSVHKKIEHFLALEEKKSERKSKDISIKDIYISLPRYLPTQTQNSTTAAEIAPPLVQQSLPSPRPAPSDSLTCASPPAPPITAPSRSGSTQTPPPTSPSRSDSPPLPPSTSPSNWIELDRIGSPAHPSGSPRAPSSQPQPTSPASPPLKLLNMMEDSRLLNIRDALDSDYD